VIEPRFKLYGYWRSSSSWRVRIGLGLKGLAYEYAAVDLRTGAQFSSPHAERNAMGQVPVLEVVEEGRTLHLVQSVAILEWLEERFPSPPLLPDERNARARVRALVEHVNSGIQPFQNSSPLRWLREHGGLDEAWAREWIGRGLAGLEGAVRRGAGRFCHGDAVTLADVFVVPQLYGARRYGVDVGAFPTLLRVEESCRMLEAFRLALPEVQPDAPAAERRS